jgi:hypothetical protein
MPTVWFIGVLAVCHQFPTAGHSVRWWIWFWSVFSGHVLLHAGSVRSFCWVGFWVLALDFGETHTSVGLSVGFYGVGTVVVMLVVVWGGGFLRRFVLIRCCCGDGLSRCWCWSMLCVLGLLRYLIL